MNLRDFSKDKKMTEFEVVNVSWDADQNGGKIAILHLKNPIDVVEGSMTIGDRDVPGSQERVKAYDVETVRVHERDFDDPGIDLDLTTGKGFVKSDLRLDVSSRRFEVWLTSKTFLALSRETRAANRSQQTGGLLTKMQEKAAARNLKSADTGGGGQQPIASERPAATGATN